MGNSRCRTSGYLGCFFEKTAFGDCLGLKASLTGLYMGVSEKRGPYYSTLNSRIHIIRTPNKVPLIFGNSHIGLGLLRKGVRRGDLGSRCKALRMIGHFHGGLFQSTGGEQMGTTWFDLNCRNCSRSLSISSSKPFDMNFNPTV